MYNFKILYLSITPMVINLGIYSQGYRGLQIQTPTPTLKFPIPLLIPRWEAGENGKTNTFNDTVTYFVFFTLVKILLKEHSTD